MYKKSNKPERPRRDDQRPVYLKSTMRKYRDSSKSEMDSQRELLDSLMGLNRNNDKGDNQVTTFPSIF